MLRCTYVIFLLFRCCKYSRVRPNCGVCLRCLWQIKVFVFVQIGKRYVKFSVTVMNVHHNAHSDVTVDNRVYVEMAFLWLKMGHRIAFWLLAQVTSNILYVIMTSEVCTDVCAMSRWGGEMWWHWISGWGKEDCVAVEHVPKRIRPHTYNKCLISVSCNSSQFIETKLEQTDWRDLSNVHLVRALRAEKYDVSSKNTQP
jgi:hypothetical protein